MKMNITLLKKHPLATGSIIVVGGLVLYFVWMRGDSSGGGSTTVVQPSQGQLQLAAAQIQSNTALQGAAIQYAYQSHVSDEQYQLGMANLSTQLQALQIQSNTTDIANKLAAQTQIAQLQISGQTQTNLAALSSQTQIALGAQQLAGYQAMIQGNVDIAKYALQAQQYGDTTGLLGSLVGGLF